VSGRSHKGLVKYLFATALLLATYEELTNDLQFCISYVTFIFFDIKVIHTRCVCN